MRSPIADWASRLSKTSIWYIHGAKDREAPIAEADALVQALRVGGSNMRYTRLDDADHFLLDRYYEREWQDWLLEHRR